MKLRDQWFIKIEAPLVHKISGLAIVKMLDKWDKSTFMLKVKFLRNLATLDVTKSSLETAIFDPKEMLGVLDLRSLGYHKVNQGMCYKTQQIL